MARFVKRFRKQSYAVIMGAETASETASICGCGLSADAVVGSYADIRSDKQAQAA